MREPITKDVKHNIVERLKNFFQDFYDKLRSDYLFKKKEKKLVEVAKKARQEIAEGKAKVMDYNKL